MRPNHFRGTIGILGGFRTQGHQPVQLKVKLGRELGNDYPANWHSSLLDKGRQSETFSPVPLADLLPQ